MKTAGARVSEMGSGLKDGCDDQDSRTVRKGSTMPEAEWEELRKRLCTQFSEDIVQTVLLKLYEYLSSGQTLESEPIYWCRTVAYRAKLDDRSRLRHCRRPRGTNLKDTEVETQALVENKVRDALYPDVAPNPESILLARETVRERFAARKPSSTERMRRHRARKRAKQNQLVAARDTPFGALAVLAASPS